MGLDLRLLPGLVAVCHLDADDAVPEWAAAGPLTSITRTPDELSIVCDEASVPDDVRAERGWRALMVEGTLDFGLTGILLQLAEPLATADISIFALSTYDTDYVLVRDRLVGFAVRVLTDAGHTVR